ncbi:hypothetical protein PK69_18485 [Xanthomonas phaseoli pv. phaseoli]|uniref:Uncharacterized protein n=1 Tax=Xanthomonas campestris pv. phaseoli TaxID=317013 RepID=A0AB34QLV8_XANCH|nr:hypothetical protein AC609_18375 [Xanthomonas phaseoli pv. phaseoli]AZU31711.1 hypothetical protein AC801_18075 [Xanthomonas sp. ISO98C4]AZU27373.1 hypothetical protein AC611_18395 [Xanthomonas phaseoli pv. phaseoli]AZU36138.1 hypothetical protein AC610_18365 [Xanthomonas phaseoli pv. phaseoli]KGT49022.1 hypothetical protein NZ02_21935 [Xanthomonas phaseoli pv. phaseoli]
MDTCATLKRRQNCGGCNNSLALEQVEIGNVCDQDAITSPERPSQRRIPGIEHGNLRQQHNDDSVKIKLVLQETSEPLLMMQNFRTIDHHRIAPLMPNSGKGLACALAWFCQSAQLCLSRCS